MARNEEKAQSMLYRFREGKMMELGLANRIDKRPRMASACNDLRQCERWRGEIMREISRKVSKIQDAGMTDYEVRDLNDEINKLLREKSHWETQIINLGGANYKRAAGSMMVDGKEVPGIRGYKYFGRAKELPGVKELFQQASAEQAELESYKTQQVSMFENVDASYYGELDDAELVEAEREAELAAWKKQYAQAAELLDLPEDTPVPPLPQAEYVTLSLAPAESEPEVETEAVINESPAAGGKRKATNGAVDEAAAKKAKSESGQGHRFLTVLRAEDLRPPKLPTAAEIEALIVQKQKEELLKEYV